MEYGTTAKLDRISKALAYIRRIRNAQKRAYAASYLEAWRHGHDAPVPHGLTYVGAQAVRHHLDPVLKA